MKAFRFLVVLSVILAAFGFAIQPASAQMFATYSTGTQVMNVGLATANITITYYDAAGNVLGTSPAGTTIDSFKSSTFFPPASGSAVISSDQPLAAVTNILNAASGATAGGAYVGASAGSTTVSIPLLMKANGSNPYTTWFTVQNAGSSDAAVTVDYSDCTGTSDATATIKPGAAATFYQKDEACHTLKVFSAKLTSTQPVVAVVVEENSLKILAYSGFSKGSTNPVLPLINTNNSGIATGVQVQNIGASSSDVTLSYSPVAPAVGTACTETQTIAAGSSKTFALGAFVSGPYSDTRGTTDCAGGLIFVGSARVTVNTGAMPLVAVVNQTKTAYGEAYGGFDPADATGTVVLPLIMDRNGANLFSTGISVQNVGSGVTDIKCDMTGTVPPAVAGNPREAATYTISKTAVAQYASLIDNQSGKILPRAGFVGSAVCKAYTPGSSFGTIDPAGRLVGVVNELGKTDKDRLLVYEGINIP